MSNELLEAPKSRRGVITVVLAVVVVAALVAAYFLFIRDNGGAVGAAEENTIRIGVVDDSDPYWDVFVDAAEEEGLSIEIVNYDEYSLPNPALDEGEIDLNQFQHIVFLAEYVANTDSDLVPIGSTAIYPLGLYSTQYDSVEDIPDGATVVVPDDPSNRARALLILQSAGLIELEGGGSIFSDLTEVDEAASRVEVTEAAADLTATSLDDVAAAVINNDFIEAAGLTPDDTIAEDDPSDPNALPYVNIFAARGEDKDNEDYLKLVEIYQDTQEVLDGVQEAAGGTAEFVKIPAADLETSLADTVEDTKANQG
ncbi:MetQ/NlpA family ABC transporter substrate-binding protein [Nocardioides zeae]|uniref:MetQ/NlpA family ABC transporter substrate-binding protein n=1 Tax=Nocardioides imazamoxiresistens TaxID=3231893 RepID=A0ABU3PTW7_9ACTN|nr:MetQ/NlpA family ABC transporter substrate-binding protein [Nocardioides zeae]MDT9592341.1 MetQ/NlpA family ABC transporter substrate-binding protein [Nocardioides zeae]